MNQNTTQVSQIQGDESGERFAIYFFDEDMISYEHSYYDSEALDALYDSDGWSNGKRPSRGTRHRKGTLS